MAVSCRLWLDSD